MKVYQDLLDQVGWLQWLEEERRDLLEPQLPMILRGCTNAVNRGDGAAGVSPIFLQGASFRASRRFLFAGVLRELNTELAFVCTDCVVKMSGDNTVSHALAERSVMLNEELPAV